MMRISTLTLAISALVFILSCGGKQAEKEDGNGQEIPGALQENKLDITSYSRGGDLIEELYQEQVQKSPDLQKLETGLTDHRPLPGETLKSFNRYHAQSEGFYNAVNSRLHSLADTALKSQVQQLLTASRERYRERTQAMQTLAGRIAENEKAIADHHNVLKMLLTMQVMETYQQGNLPSGQPLKEMIRKQEELVKKMDSLRPR